MEHAGRFVTVVGRNVIFRSVASGTPECPGKPYIGTEFKSRQQGCFAKINKVFGNKLESVVIELNEYLYDDGGRTA